MAAALYFALGVLRYSFLGSSLDLTIFFQALSAPPESPWFEVPLKGEGRNIFGDHFHPVILILWPLVQLVPHPLTLLASQAIAIAGGMCLLIRAYESRHEQWGSFAAAVLLGPGTLGAVMYDFHEVSLGVPLLAWWVLLLARRSYGRAALPALLLLLVKEDMAVLVFGLGLVHLLRSALVSGSALVGSSLLWWFGVTRWVIPAIAGSSYTYSASIPRDVGVLMVNLGKAFVAPGVMTLTLALLFLPFSYTSLRSVVNIALVPYCLALATAGNIRYQVFYYHYYVLPAVLIAGAALEACQRQPAPAYRPWQKQASQALVVVLIVLGPVGVELSRLQWNDQRAAARIMQRVPHGAHVATTPELGAHLAPSAEVSLLKPPAFVDANGHPLGTVEWVIVDAQTTSFSGPGWVPEMIHELESQGFREVYREGRFLLLHRPVR